VPTSEKFTLQLSALYFRHDIIQQHRALSWQRAPCLHARWCNSRVSQFKPTFQVAETLSVIQLCSWKFSHNKTL